jgi:1,6-anhydro-N-acetylmuramate kinase
LGSIVAIGLVSSQASGEVGAGLVSSDGESEPTSLAYISFAMTEATRALLAQALDRAASFDKPGPDALIDEAEQVITLLYVEAARQLLVASGKSKGEIEAVGLAGHHIATSRERAPRFFWDWSLGKGDVIAKASEMTVISGLPRDQGAPDLKAAAEAVAHIAIRRLRLLPIGDAGAGDMPIGVVHSFSPNRLP